MDWVSVKDRLPECDQKYGVSQIVWCVDSFGKMGFGIYSNTKVMFHAGWFTGGGVGEDGRTITHWMPLPVPPEK